MPADPTAVSEISPYVLPAGEAYLYRYLRWPGDLYILDGVM
jgi:hypothetical protein